MRLVATWLGDPRLPAVSLRRLLDHTSGIPDYGRLPAYAEAVRTSPSQPWDDEELLTRALAQGPDFAPGEGWAYSNTGYLLVRRIVDEAADGGFAGALERELLGSLGLAETSLALELDDLDDLVPARSRQLGRGLPDVRGLYHPCWVGHRTLASTERSRSCGRTVRPASRSSSARTSARTPRGRLSPACVRNSARAGSACARRRGSARRPSACSR